VLEGPTGKRACKPVHLTQQSGVFGSADECSDSSSLPPAGDLPRIRSLTPFTHFLFRFSHAAGVQFKDGVVSIAGQAASAEAMEKTVLMAGNVQGVSDVKIDNLQAPAVQKKREVIKDPTFKAPLTKLRSNVSSLEMAHPYL
jgi:hypothetical protein